jgi:hypothetical protein
MLDRPAPMPKAIEFNTGSQSALRLFKCGSCGYAVWVAQRWVTVATPICPVTTEEMTLVVIGETNEYRCHEHHKG